MFKPEIINFYFKYEEAWKTHKIELIIIDMSLIGLIIGSFDT